MSTIAGTRPQPADSGRTASKQVAPGTSSAGTKLERKPSARTGIRSRQNSLRRVKDSTDVLREKSLQRQKSKKDVAPDGTSGGREGRGRQFTVGNVGTNGMIYLRPVQKPQSQNVPQMPAFTFPETLPTNALASVTGSPPSRSQDAQPQARDSVWTHQSIPMRCNNNYNIHSSNPKPARNKPQRSFSQSMQERLDSGTLKIVIDRAETPSSPHEESNTAFPSIEVPIPHYRLGEPRFSAKGTAFLHQSIAGMSSMNGENADKESSMLSGGGEHDRRLTKPPGLEAHAVLSRRHSHASPQPYSIQTSFGPSSYMSISSQTYPNVPSYSGSITPQIYDALAANPNDPAIVKYSPINGDIIAASPARIIVQITSENFLDYELLSDFFLTVRAYLSSHDLLAYLLARFEWAVNRFDDNGRIIRVRAFAALRHWILNYFSYDFVVDRELRVQFCDRLNALTRFVKARSDYGASDVKLISDLKKCWNGRCALFWDSLALATEGNQDIDIQPGGVVGSRDSQLIHQSQLRFTTVVPPLGVAPAAGSTSIASWYSAVMEHGERQAQGHNRQTSTTTSRSLPISPTSEQSMPVLSCSIPAKGFKRAAPYANKAMGIHPVPMLPGGRRVCPAAPSSLANDPAHLAKKHRRSGSFSDAARDKRAPLSSEVPTGVGDYPVDATMLERSLLRGQVLAPSGPYVNAIATTPTHELSNPLPASRDNESPSGRKLSTNPNVKNIIGNIRRALSSKHNGGSASSTTSAPAMPGASAPSLSVGKSASLPLNVMYQAASPGQLEALRNLVRVDLLAADIYDLYRRVTEHGADASDNQREQSTQMLMPESSAHQKSSDRLRPPDFHRQTSAMTDSSQSILIVDDTGLNMPGIAPLSIDTHGHNQPQSNAVDDSIVSPMSVRHGAQAMSSQGHVSKQVSSISRSADSRQEGTDGTGSIINFPRTSLPSESRDHARIHSRGAVKSSSISLRRYASFQSTFSKRVPSGNMNSIASGGNKTPGSERSVHPPAGRMLRRRPGGDLRANRNVHDLEDLVRPRSAGSVTTYSESARGSELLGFGEKITRTFAGRRPSERSSPAPENLRANKPPSLVRTHSSQPEKRRPSFEAAVAQFARIPDEDEGGLEVTLLKLEGKYKSPVQSPTPPSFPDEARSLPSRSEEARETPETSRSRDATAKPGSDRSGMNTAGGGHGENSHIDPRANMVSTLYAGSEGSYNSVPLLERGPENGEDDDDVPASRQKMMKSTGPRSSLARDHMSSGELVYETLSMRRLRHGSSAPTATTDSFLLDENDEFISDVSSEFSMETVDADEEVWLTQNSRTEHEDMVLVGHSHPPSPPMSMENARSISSQANQLQQQRNPPTPDPSPVNQYVEPRIPGRVPNQPRHMCFVLGCDSALLAQQFTLIEKDALKEVDWRDLVDMRWQNTATSTTNWVEYLLTQDPLGIDLVTARFNIMVKWALSEIVLTENIEERALTIMKYIHIAQKARELNNYATLLQLTIALTSADCTRLSKTWNVVPDAEKEMLQDLEMLVSPRRNFHHLRVEMEKANAEQGCIPVVALYIHDLTYNAQKPSQLPGAHNGEPLINFERYRSTAVIVKNLLRLIEASTKYTYQPVEGVTERCLWMACLSDEIITHKSKQREYSSV